MYVIMCFYVLSVPSLLTAVSRPTKRGKQQQSPETAATTPITTTITREPVLQLRRRQQRTTTTISRDRCDDAKRSTVTTTTTNNKLGRQIGEEGQQEEEDYAPVRRGTDHARIDPGGILGSGKCPTWGLHFIIVVIYFAIPAIVQGYHCSYLLRLSCDCRS